MPSLTFVSGWSGYRQLFDGLECQHFFLPFIDYPPAFLTQKLRAGNSDLLVGWSFGAFCILHDLSELVARYKKIILLAPFLSFSHWHKKQELEKLAKALATRPQTALTAFWRQCDCPLVHRVPPKDYPLLRTGLTSVQKSQALPVPCSGTNLTIVHGCQDKIIPPQSSQELHSFYPEARTFFLPQNGHWFSPQKILEICHETRPYNI